MAYAEKRSGVLTGQWLGEVRTKIERFKRSFQTKKEAEAYEAYVGVMGVEPPTVLEGKQIATTGRSFREIAARCKAAGGPRGVWGNGRDHSTLQRLEHVVGIIGAYDIEDVTRGLIREKVVADLKKRPKPGNDKTKLLKQGTINRYVSAASAVLTWAVNEDVMRHKPQLEFKKERDKTPRAVVDFKVEDGAVAWLEGEGLHVHAVCVRWLVVTGMRTGELWKLAPEQIANDHVLLKSEQTKGDRPRLVYVPADLCREMRAIVASKLLPDRTQLLRKFQKAAIAAGSESHVVLHGLRHTRNTRMRKAGVSQSVRKEILGHTSDQVNDGYDHIDLDDQRAAAAAVEQLRGERGANVVNLSEHAKTPAQETPENIGFPEAQKSP